MHAVVVLKDGARATPEELIAHCRTQIGGYKCPRSVEFRAEPLPVTAVGKVRKNVLEATMQALPSTVRVQLLRGPST